MRTITAFSAEDDRSKSDNKEILNEEGQSRCAATQNKS